MNTTCTRITLPASIFRPRLITPHPQSTTTKAATSKSRPLIDGFTRRLRAQRTRVCAWLERGGVFDSALMPQPRPRALLQDRLRCVVPASTNGNGDNASRWGPAPHACSPSWADFDDPRAVTFKWIGTDGKSISVHPYPLLPPSQ
ncbi:hypothetical protein EGR_04083 [Echinococcus granulosus]|uniref:Uncharacterized protein n=1 Tax=Echinococcus granulosus TaxID=6210 RepID=W6UHS9_ECHGR|nr:hypothetical protein EGR_04083 [Echinococcus granulosus]EUB61050.1 hypothetical protein EGR_04083 [Echinococcus granulosus]